MVLKRQLRQGGEEDRELPNKRRHLASTICKGLNCGRNLQESLSCLEPIIRKWVQESVERAFDSSLRSSYNQVESSVSKSLQLQFHSNVPETLFTGNRLLSEDKNPIKLVLYNSITKHVITSGPLSSLKVTIAVLNGDFDREDWTAREFENKLVKNREGKRPLVAGELIVTLRNGVGYIGDLSFTDNSSWIRSGKFRLGAIANTGDEISIREAVSNAFRVKDHRGESYQKHYPPSLDDEVWRLEKIAKDGSSHKKLNELKIKSVGDFLRLNATDHLRLRAILAVSNKTWETIIGHAMTCNLDDKRYMYRTAHGTGLLFNSINKVVGVTFDGEDYHPVNSLNNFQMRIVEDLKQHAYRNLKEWVPVCAPSVAGNPMLLESPAANSFTSHNSGLHVVDFPKQDNQYEVGMNAVEPTMSSATEMEQDKCSFELPESPRSTQCFNPTFRNSFEFSDSPPGFCFGNNYVAPHLSTDDLPITDSYFLAESSSSAWQAGDGLKFLDYSGNQGDIGMLFSNNSSMVSPRSPRTRWCKVLAVVKWRILVRRNVAARKWNRLYSYM